jgi:hypothetical protein
MDELFLSYGLGFPTGNNDAHIFLNSFFYHVLNPLAPAAYLLLFRTMERCDNLICSDRLTIFANVCGFRYKLDFTVLNDVKYSYSTCMLALIMANEVGDKITVDLPKIDMSKVDLEQNVEWYLHDKYRR